jgi:hypothetical protein
MLIKFLISDIPPTFAEQYIIARQELLHETLTSSKREPELQNLRFVNSRTIHLRHAVHDRCGSPPCGEEGPRLPQPFFDCHTHTQPDDPLEETPAKGV